MINLKKALLLYNQLVSLRQSILAAFFLSFSFSGFGQSGAALNFDGLDDKVVLSTTLGTFGTSNFTFETWFKSTGTGDRTIVAKRTSCAPGNFWNLRLINGALHFEVYGVGNLSTVSPLSTYNDGNWHHAACVRNKNTYSLFVDGNLVVQNFSGPGAGVGSGLYNYTNNTALTIGSGPCGFFAGSLDETRIWNVARTANDIKKTYNCEIAGASSGLMLNLHYNQGIGGGANAGISSVTDASGNNMDGTLSGFALTGAISNFTTGGAVASGVSCAPVAEQNFQLNGLGGEDWNGGNCYTLTTNQQGLFGSMWYKQKVDLSQDFDMSANLNFGTNNSPGADGITFAFQNVCTSSGEGGGGIGIAGVSPSLIVEFDTYKNSQLSDPDYDHVAIQKNGDIAHNSAAQLAAPVQIDASNVNVENGTDYLVRIQWVAATKVLNVFVNGNLRTSYTGDIVAQIFNNSPFVYWGFTAGTGGEFNLQKVCVTTLPTNIVSLATSANSCIGIGYQANIQGYNSYSWVPATGVSNPAIGNPVLNPTTNTTYTLSVTDACNNVQKQSIALTVTPVPVVTASAASNSVCINGTVQLNASGATTYTWSPSASLSAANISNPVATITANTTYTVTGTTNGCTGTGTVTIQGLPGPVATITSPTTTICPGASVLISSSLAAGQTAKWFLNNQQIPNQTGATLSANQAGSYTVKITTTVGGCTTESSPIVLAPGGAVSTIVAASNSFCPGVTSILLTANAGASSYKWFKDGAVIPNATSATYSATTNGSYTVETTTGTCTNTSAATVLGTGTNPTAQITAANPSFCAGLSTPITANTLAGASYSWLLNNSQIPGATNVLDASAAGSYSVRITNSQGCSAVSNSIAITETPAPAASISASAGAICSGASVTLTAPAQAGATYEWFKNTQSQGAPSATNTFVTNAVGNYQVTVRLNGCSKTSLTRTLATGTFPGNADNITGFSTFCMGDVATYSTFTVAGATSYFWEILPSNYATVAPNSGLYAQGTKNIKVNFMNLGITLKVTPRNDCGNGGSFEMAINPTNVGCFGISFGGIPSTNCVGEPILFVNYTDPNDYPNGTANWDFGVGANPATATGDGPHTVTYSSVGNKQVVLKYKSPSGLTLGTETRANYVQVDDPSVCATSVLPLAQGNNDDYFSVFPNPGQNRVSLKLKSEHSGAVQMDLLDMQGKTILHKTFVSADMSLDVSQLQNGFYMVRVNDGKRISSQKLVIQK